jgi:hypothetical protein
MEVDAEASLRPTSGQKRCAVRSQVARSERNESMTRLSVGRETAPAPDDPIARSPDSNPPYLPYLSYLSYLPYDVSVSGSF